MPASPKRPLFRNDLCPIRMKSEWENWCHRGSLFLFLFPPFFLSFFNHPPPTPTTFPHAKVCGIRNRNMTSWVPEWKKSNRPFSVKAGCCSQIAGRRSRSRMNVVGSSYNYNSSKIWSHSGSYLPRFQHCKPFLLAMTHVSTIRASRVTTSATTYRQWSIHHR